MKPAFRLSPALALRAAAAAVALGALTAGALAALPSASASARSGAAGRTIAAAARVHDGYVFATYGNSGDTAFNQLLGINDNDQIAGYFGSGAQGSPNQGYTLVPPFGQASYTSENFPGSVQTQVTGLNDNGITVGFFSYQNTASQSNDNFGFYQDAKGGFHEVNYPTGDPATPPVDQLLGVNGHDVAVGFFTNGQRFNRSYTYNIRSRTFGKVLEPGHPGANLTATGIDNAGDISGFYTVHGTTEGFLKTRSGFVTLKVPGSSSTMAFGLNNSGEVVGDYTVGSGSKQVMHGFTWTRKHGFLTVDDPRGNGSTTVNGINNEGDLVGFYTTHGGNITDGFLAIPARNQVKNIVLDAMPSGRGQFGINASGFPFVKISGLYGLTPGSSHEVVIFGRDGLTGLGILTANGAGQVGDITLSGESAVKVPKGTRVDILNGASPTAVDFEPIATSPALSPAGGSFTFTSVERSSDGKNFGTPQAVARAVYNPVRQTLQITVTARNLTPGAHAAHVHLGSCMSQGPVLYMLKDFVVDRHGNFVAETRTLTGVNAPLPAAGWYLNLHQGNSGNIVANGAPTINFRPLLCRTI
jgi:hypothetical protein